MHPPAHATVPVCMCQGSSVAFLHDKQGVGPSRIAVSRSVRHTTAVRAAADTSKTLACISSQVTAAAVSHAHTHTPLSHRGSLGPVAGHCCHSSAEAVLRKPQSIPPGLRATVAV